MLFLNLNSFLPVYIFRNSEGQVCHQMILGLLGLFPRLSMVLSHHFGACVAVWLWNWRPGPHRRSHGNITGYIFHLPTLQKLLCFHLKLRSALKHSFSLSCLDIARQGCLCSCNTSCDVDGSLGRSRIQSGALLESALEWVGDCCC